MVTLNCQKNRITLFPNITNLRNPKGIIMNLNPSNNVFLNLTSTVTTSKLKKEIIICFGITPCLLDNSMHIVG